MYLNLGKVKVNLGSLQETTTTPVIKITPSDSHTGQLCRHACDDTTDNAPFPLKGAASNRHDILMYRCEKCGYLESYAPSSARPTAGDVTAG